MLEVEALEAGYGASQVLFGMTLKVNAGEAVTLIGRNGMGKTTTVRAITGQIAIRGGAVTFLAAGDFQPDGSRPPRSQCPPAFRGSKQRTAAGSRRRLRARASAKSRAGRPTPAGPDGCCP